MGTVHANSDRLTFHVCYRTPPPVTGRLVIMHGVFVGRNCQSYAAPLIWPSNNTKCLHSSMLPPLFLWWIDISSTYFQCAFHVIQIIGSVPTAAAWIAVRPLELSFTSWCGIQTRPVKNHNLSAFLLSFIRILRWLIFPSFTKAPATMSGYISIPWGN